MKKSAVPTRVRTKFTKDQLNALELLYKHNSKPVKEQMVELGQHTGLELRIIQVWFQNRRVKERNQQLAQFDLPMPIPPNLTHIVDLMHMPTSEIYAYPNTFVVPSTQIGYASYPDEAFYYDNGPLYMYPPHQEYSQYPADLSQGLMSI